MKHMKLSISNLAWDPADDKKIYEYLRKKRFSGIEIAPTKIFPDAPYEHTDDAVCCFDRVKREYGLEVSSMQSIWYGQGGNIFQSPMEREHLRNYTFKAIDFASAIGCKNLVFGNPKARTMGEAHTEDEVYDFFRAISDYAYERGTCIALEANPVIYGTDFINTTEQAFAFCKHSGCEHLRVNVDLGTMIYNDEPFDLIEENIDMVNHIHISEPYLKKIEKRELHRSLTRLNYDRYISVEMGLQPSLKDVSDVVDYIEEVFQ